MRQHEAASDKPFDLATSAGRRRVLQMVIDAMLAGPSNFEAAQLMVKIVEMAIYETSGAERHN